MNSHSAEHFSGDRLPCGADADVVLDQVSAGRAAVLDTHQRGCPHCWAALAEYDRLWAPVRELAATEVHPPASVMEEAMRNIQKLSSASGFGALHGPGGSTRISARVVVVVARETAQAVEGVRVALGHLLDGGVTAQAPSARRRADSLDERPRATAGVTGRSTAVEVVLAAQYGTDLVALAERIRTAVGREIRDLTGLEPVAVSVCIDDVFG